MTRLPYLGISPSVTLWSRYVGGSGLQRVSYLKRRKDQERSRDSMPYDVGGWSSAWLMRLGNLWSLVHFWDRWWSLAYHHHPSLQLRLHFSGFTKSSTSFCTGCWCSSEVMWCVQEAASWSSQGWLCSSVVSSRYLLQRQSVTRQQVLLSARCSPVCQERDVSAWQYRATDVI